MGDLSEHFSRSEFRCRHCGELGPGRELRLLVDRLEVLRAIVGRPLVIVSGYRCRRHPLELRKPANAFHRHSTGLDADLEYLRVTVDQAARAGFTAIGRRGKWATHVGLSKPAAVWKYE